MRKDLTYIVTGCTGYVGNVITKKLLDEGYNVIGLAKKKEKVNRVFKEKTPTIIYGDIRNNGTITAASVNILVVSWNDADDKNESVCNAALVIPNNIG